MSYHVFIDSLSAGFSQQVDVLRLDLVHPEFGGNKFFKLRKNIETARQLGKDTILTFGGAFSNHIAATAAACKAYGFKSIGIIRGERHETLNPTLIKAEEDGMKLVFVSREEFKLKNVLSYKLKLQMAFPGSFIIPEGGANKYGIEGCEEILNFDNDYDYIVCACGTGSTYKGILSAVKNNQLALGISVLKGENSLPKEVNSFFSVNNKDLNVGGNEILERKIVDTHAIINSYHLGGYAAYNKEMIEFKSNFEKRFKIKLDYVYTSKLFYAVFDLLAKDKFKEHSKILIVHSGGIQGNSGFEERYHLIPTL